ncbi:nuclease domain-containing protein [Jeotgalibacillus haloalkalitolerans]|uniref:Nuclease domain-containing protein n=1 Tax=Jeotgalibacillus haloalkalitolerans TaxID=3104292 RepID=A0ABU5KJD3_9BACL|nr:nuclease domain-containing protein [Jeotgalibacillus sp. HH7-29]MDZ5711372.1 nuclease domain-containing protein [Jeotgalibacillus sp. HH7-29]
MEIKPIMINVHYDKNAELYERMLPVINIEEVAEIQFDPINECWYTFNHYQNYSVIEEEVVYAQIGFKVIRNGHEKKSEEVMYIKNDEGVNKKLFLYKDVWFELSKFKFNKKKKRIEYSSEKRDQIAGLNQSGNLIPILKTLSGQTIKDGKNVLFLPSSISLDNYRIMVADIFYVYIDLLRDSHSNVVLSRQKTKSLEWIKEIISIIEKPINKINRNPEQNFNVRISNEKINQSEKIFDPMTLIQQEIFLGKNKIKRPVIYKEVNTYENRIIKQFLMSLKFYINLYLKEKLIDSKKLNIESELKVLKAKKDFLTSFDKNDVQQLSDIEARYDKELKKYVQNLKVNLKKTLYHTHENTNMNNMINVELKFAVTIPIKSKKTDYINGDIETEYSTEWNNSSGKWDLELISYSYQKDTSGKIVVSSKTTEKFNKKFKLQLRSKNVNEHLSLLKSFKELENNKTYLYAISGNIQKDKEVFDFSNKDFIGKNEKGNYKKYNFLFSEIKEIYVNNNKIDLSRKYLLDDLVNELLSMDKTYAGILDKQMENRLKISSYKEQQGLRSQLSNILGEEQEYKKLYKKIKYLLSLKLFKDIEITNFEFVKATQLFLHNTDYRVVWEVLKQNKFLQTPSLFAKNNQNFISIKNVNDIYEIWSFIKMFYLLKNELGWKLEDKRSFTSEIELFLSGKNNKKKNLNEFIVNLYKNDHELELCYNPKLPRHNQASLTPDYRFIIRNKKNPTFHLTVYLDAKYRNYREQSENAWIRDIKEVAIEKYLRTTSTDIDLKGDLSFILHCDDQFGDEKEVEGTNYSAAYDKRFQELNGNKLYLGEESNYNQVFLKREEYGHRVGSIFMTPQSTFSFIKWFRMIMEYHVGDHKTCWRCGSTHNQVIETETSTETGYPKLYLECNTCGEFWVKVHCRNGHKLIKHTNNFHQQKDNSNSWYVICPLCFQGK